MEQSRIPDKNAAPPTQQFIEIDGMKNGTLILKGGGLRQILLVSGVNFSLKSEEEQNMLLGLFQNFLNSLDFAIQIFIHSRKVNIDRYLENLSLREEQETNELLKTQVAEYREFIRAFVSANAIMSKSYFVVIPYEPIQTSATGEAAASKLFGFLKKKGVEKPTERIGDADLDAEKKLDQHIEQLSHRVSQVISGLNQIDLRAVPLNDNELTELFYNLYNPEAVDKKGIEINRIQ